MAASGRICRVQWLLRCCGLQPPAAKFHLRVQENDYVICEQTLIALCPLPGSLLLQQVHIGWKLSHRYFRGVGNKAIVINRRVWHHNQKHISSNHRISIGYLSLSLSLLLSLSLSLKDIPRAIVWVAAYLKNRVESLNTSI